MLYLILKLCILFFIVASIFLATLVTIYLTRLNYDLWHNYEEYHHKKSKNTQKSNFQILNNII